MAKLFLRDDFAARWADLDAFEVVGGLRGEVFREVGQRRTFRFELEGERYFAKVHGGVGWVEIIKNLLTLRQPVLGAVNEYEACRHLAARGVRAPRVAAFGCRGVNPARRRSFVICDALEDHLSLEDLAAHWREAPPTRDLKRRIVEAVANLAAAVHRAGVNHRDFYICHVLLDRRALARGDVKLAVIDLHRAEVRERTPVRWLYRDLAALLFSSDDLELSDGDRRRFLAGYTRAVGRRHGADFWRRVHRRADGLRKKGRREGD